MNHTASGTALLSYIMYLCRFRKTGSLPDKAEASLQVDRDRLLQQAASGTTIVDIHHMITCYIFLTWEKSALYDKQPLPWSLLAEWIGSKSVDKNRMSFILSYIGEDIAPEDKIPSDYEQWKSIFASRDKKKITAITLSLLRRSWKQTCDWLFRAYADYYTPDWDPHYYTSLYAALEMYHDQSVNKTGSSMAVVQALEYFLSNI